MDDKKTEWEVGRLKKETEDHDKRLDSLEKFQVSVTEKLKTVFERLKDLESSNKWMGQSFFYLLAGGVISAVFSLIVWLVQK